MASSYGPWVGGDDWRSWVEIKIVSETETTATISVSGWFQADAGWSTYSNTVKGYLGYKIGSAADVWSSATAIDPFSAGSSKYFLTGTFKSVSVPKTQSAQTVKGYAEVDGYTGGGYAGSQSKATASITVSAKPTYAITYNANGGSGAPAAGSKWHGETFTLSTTKPTRANYNFTGWNTKADGTGTNYASGGTIPATVNAATTLYAQWTIAATTPQITKLVAYRSDDSGNRVSTSSTTQTDYITVEYGWSVDTGTTSRKIRISLASSDITLSANSGTGTVTYAKALDNSSSLTVTATLTDSTHSLTAARSVLVGTLVKPFTMANGGMAAAFFGFANSAWDKVLKIFGDLVVENHIDISGKIKMYVDGAKGDAGLRFYKSALNANHWNPAILIQTKSGGTWTIGNYDGEELRFVYFTKANIDSSTNTAGLNLALGNTARSWHKAISPWTSIATTSGETAKTFSDVSTAGYSELLVVATYSTTYRSSVVIPVAMLDTTKRDWFLGGGTWSTTWGASCGMTKTQITPYKVRIGGANQDASWTVYAR